jgi:hypothetical protein
MFGFKILKMRNFRMVEESMRNLAKEKEEAMVKYLLADGEKREIQRQLEEKKKAYDKLYKTNNKLYKSVNKLLTKLKGKCDIEFKVLSDPSPCDLCKHEMCNCRKLTVGTKEFCVVPVPSFSDDENSQDHDTD